MVHTSTFGLTFGSLSPAVTLKIRSRSPKPYQLFVMSQCYIHANLVKIHPLVHDISCKQESATLTPTLTPTPTGSAPKTICPPPLRWGELFYAVFRRRYRTTVHIFTIKTILNKYINKYKKQVYACFVDFSKAFDTVWHSGLLKKILNLGIGGKFDHIVKYMYSNSWFVVRKHNTVSDAGISRKGVRQGDGLEPHHFQCFCQWYNWNFWHK